MSNAPAHTPEHDEIMKIVAIMQQRSKLIDLAILITIGKDGRPVVAGNATPEEMSNIMSTLGGARDFIAGTTVLPDWQEN